MESTVPEDGQPVDERVLTYFQLLREKRFDHDLTQVREELAGDETFARALVEECRHRSEGSWVLHLVLSCLDGSIAEHCPRLVDDIRDCLHESPDLLSALSPELAYQIMDLLGLTDRAQLGLVNREHSLRVEAYHSQREPAAEIAEWQQRFFSGIPERVNAERETIQLQRHLEVSWVTKVERFVHWLNASADERKYLIPSLDGNSTYSDDFTNTCAAVIGNPEITRKLFNHLMLSRQENVARDLAWGIEHVFPFHCGAVLGSFLGLVKEEQFEGLWGHHSRLTLYSKWTGRFGFARKDSARVIDCIAACIPARRSLVIKGTNDRLGIHRSIDTATRRWLTSNATRVVRRLSRIPPDPEQTPLSEAVAAINDGLHILKTLDFGILTDKILDEIARDATRCQRQWLVSALHRHHATLRVSVKSEIASWGLRDDLTLLEQLESELRDHRHRLSVYWALS